MIDEHEIGEAMAGLNIVCQIAKQMDDPWEIVFAKLRMVQGS